MAVAPVDPKKKKPTAADQADAIDNTPLPEATPTPNVQSAKKGTSAEAPRTWQDLQEQEERRQAQAAIDADKFTVKSKATPTQTIQAGYNVGISQNAQIKALEKQGKSVAEIVKILGLKPKV